MFNNYKGGSVMSKKLISFFEYILAFLGFIGMYFFITPCSDIYFFSRDYENSVGSFISNAYNYGNGRYFGNFLGFATAHNFLWGFLLIAVAMTLFVFFVNKFFFNGDHRTVMPVALLLAFPSSGTISEVYSDLPTFINYVVPMVLVFATLCVIKSEKLSKIKPLSAVFVFILSAASCLFCENNTISIFILALLVAFYSYVRTKKLDLTGVVYVVGSVVGAFIMFMLPKITGTSHNLDYYRGTADSVSSMITLAIASFSTFTEIFSEYVFAIIPVSASLIFLVAKNKACKNILKKITLFYLAFFPVEAVLYTIVSSSAPASVYMYLLQAGFVTLYALSILNAIFCLQKSNFRTLMLGLFVLILSSVGPMMFADKYGYRTFYLPFVIFLSTSFILLKQVVAELPKNALAKFPKKKVGSFAVCVASAAFICLSASIFIQSVYNYDFYVVRTQYIAEQADESAERVNVPALPCRGISGEDENPSIFDAVLYKSGVDMEIAVTESIFCENSGEYYAILDTDPISNTIFAIQHLDFKNSAYVYELIKV